MIEKHEGFVLFDGQRILEGGLAPKGTLLCRLTDISGVCVEANEHSVFFYDAARLAARRISKADSQKLKNILAYGKKETP